jgi:hypothetical protein
VYVQFSANSDVYCPVVMARSQKRWTTNADVFTKTWARLSALHQAR